MRQFPWLGLCLVVAVGCGPRNVYKPPPPPTVAVAQPVRKTVTKYLEETGTTEAVEKVEIRARVRGFLDEVAFEPGTMVDEGAILYKIEPDLFEAQRDAAQAELDAQKARLKKATIERDRQYKLREEDPGATSDVAVVASEAEYNSAQAGVQAAQAALNQAELDLSYTNVTSPIAGRVGKTLVKKGNLVGDTDATHLTDVIKYDPIYANFNISENALLEITARRAGQDDRTPDKSETELYLRRGTDRGFPFKGQLDYADLAVDQSMGTFMIRGIFPNPDYQILPGLFVRIRIPVELLENALLIPERALVSDQSGTYVLVVNDQNEVERRPITPGIKQDDMIVVLDGLQGDEWTIIDGLQRARPGAKVDPKQDTLTPPGDDVEAVAQQRGPLPEQASADEPVRVEGAREPSEGAPPEGQNGPTSDIESES